MSSKPAATSQPAPWEDPAAQAPRVRINLSQQGSGKWVTDRTVEFQAIDPLDPTAAGLMADTLDRLDVMIREHVAELYARDSADLDRYFAERDRKGGGAGATTNYRRAG